MVMSMMELCPLEFKNVGVVPLLAQDKPQVVRNSSNSSPLLLHSLLPQSLCCALVSDPMISGVYLHLFMRQFVLGGGIVMLPSIYDDAMMISLESCFIFKATRSGVVN